MTKEIKPEYIEPIELTAEELYWFGSGLVPRREITREELEKLYPPLTSHK